VEGIDLQMFFRKFFPSRPSVSSINGTTSVDGSQKNLPGAERKPLVHAGSVLGEPEIANLKLAKRFADAIPEGEMSV